VDLETSVTKTPPSLTYHEEKRYERETGSPNRGGSGMILPAEMISLLFLYLQVVTRDLTVLHTKQQTFSILDTACCMQRD
jgi:uncharacterized membrane protein